MHICFLTGEYPLPGQMHGGVGSFIRTLAEGLIKNGHQVSVVGVGYHTGGVYVEHGVKIYAMQVSKWKFGKFWDSSRSINKVVRNIHKETPIDIIEATELGLAFIKKIKGVRYVIRMNGGHHYFTIAEKRPKEWWKAVQEKRSFSKADSIAAVSQYVADTTRRLLKIKKEIKILYNPVNVSRFPKANGQKTTTNELLFIGTVCEKKGVRQLVQAMPIVKKEFPDVTLKIVGRDWKFVKTGASYTTYLKTFIDEEIEDNVAIVGVVPNEQIPTYLERAEVCVFPSHMEAMPLAWLEALAMGKPFVGSTEGPGPETVINGSTGLLANPFDPADIAQKIIYLLSNKEKARALGEAARKDVMQRFDINKCISDNIEFYKKVIR